MAQFFASTTSEVSKRESQNRERCRRIAAEGMVLLENKGVLPMVLKGREIALFGSGARHTVRGGTGSGEVNAREYRTVEQGLEDAGAVVTTKAWLNRYDELAAQTKAAFAKELKEKNPDAIGSAFWQMYQYRVPAAIPVKEDDFATSDDDTAVFVLSRNSGEGSDRKNEPGDYQFAAEETEFLETLCKHYRHVVVVLNVGGVIDTRPLREIEGIGAVVLMSQAGVAGGDALADVLAGKVVPCGHLTTTWAEHYEDYPNAANFGRAGGNMDDEYYTEGVFVGYRWFDSFGKTPAYPFGYGLSYTTFSYEAEGLSLQPYMASEKEWMTLGKEPVTPGKESVTLGKEPGGLEKEVVMSVKLEIGSDRAQMASEKVATMPEKESAALGNSQTAAWKDKEPKVVLKVRITNTGSRYSGRAVPQLYVSKPSGKLAKPYQELVSYAKTRLLAPGEAEELELEVSGWQLASYDESRAAWVLEAGDYILRLGEHSRATKVVGVLRLTEEIVYEQLTNICPLDCDMKCIPVDRSLYLHDAAEEAQLADALVLLLDGICPPSAACERGQAMQEGQTVQSWTQKNQIQVRQEEWEQPESRNQTEQGMAMQDLAECQNARAGIQESVGCQYARAGMQESARQPETGKAVEETAGKPGIQWKMEDVRAGRTTVRELASQLTVEEMAELCVGTERKDSKEPIVVGASSTVCPGAAGDTTSSLAESRGIRNLVLADGPAGLRLSSFFLVNPDGKVVYASPALGEGHAAMFFPEAGKIPEEKDLTAYYQYCTAIPIATLLAQTWDVDAVREAGDIVGGEMEELNISLWLAPGMNIHRNPLCGRNFEYYSEDPLVSGRCAAADTQGVQSHPGAGTTIKHFACNNLEDNRTFNNSHVTERALREIYLKGFEIAVKTAQPLSIMSSYNLLNGVHTANNRNLITVVARGEWSFQGFVMTDWGTTNEPHSDENGKMPKYGCSSAAACIKAGNDMVMPGSRKDVEEIIASVDKDDAACPLTRCELQQCVEHILNVIARMD